MTPLHRVTVWSHCSNN